MTSKVFQLHEKRNKRKHKLRIAPVAANPPATHVWFQCVNCAANVHIDRKNMEGLLSGEASIKLPTDGAWTKCPHD